MCRQVHYPTVLRQDRTQGVKAFRRVQFGPLKGDFDRARFIGRAIAAIEAAAHSLREERVSQVYTGALFFRNAEAEAPEGPIVAAAEDGSSCSSTAGRVPRVRTTIEKVPWPERVGDKSRASA